ncbi:ChaN family lipoprotein [Marinobacter mobilis]|uniref:Uncharacterized iron-regulated protein n=1 Tax=Marinobacter mobilis TaxID=488533 RepID=A0A1H2QGZ2_9GAMM|nr:ChaN family lipoprotein [Marinobacter mobilis]SDW05689.1 Uncharacterized iron-regulated protein [Marinobacter mobilis]
MTKPGHYLLCSVLLAVAGCSSLDAIHREGARHDASRPLQTLYETRIIEAATGTPQTLPALAETLVEADVVVIGEYHGHPGAHLLQSQIQQALYQRRPDQILTLEQFAIDRQPALDRYLAGETGEREMIEEAAAWANYQASYRPLVEFAIANDLPVIATNAPREVVRCVGRQGTGYLDTLTPDVRATLPEPPFPGSTAYRDKFLATMAGGSHGSRDQSRLMNSYQAQLLRDYTMASRILVALEQHPGAQILHLTGTFHSEDHLGTVQAIQQQAPDLDVVVLSPIFSDSEGAFPDLAGQRDRGDFLYLLSPLPVQFRDAQRQLRDLQRRFADAPPIDCQPEP